MSNFQTISDDVFISFQKLKTDSACIKNEQTVKMACIPIG